MNTAFWDRPSIQHSIKYLEAWGDVVRARRATGDSTHIPAPDSCAGRGARGAPSNLPDIELAYLEVERAIEELPRPGSELMRDVLRALYADWLHEYEDELGLWHRQYQENWEEFESPRARDIGEKLGLTALDLKPIWQRMHRRFVERFAKSRQPHRQQVAA